MVPIKPVMGVMLCFTDAVVAQHNKEPPTPISLENPATMKLVFLSRGTMY
jgi:hypothetical protein